MPSFELPPELSKLINDLRQEMREMRSVMEKELRKDFKELKLSIDFFSEQFDKMATRCTKIEKENVGLKKENASLSAQCKALQQSVTDTEQRMIDIEQYSRNRNIEIKGIPFDENENLPDLLKKLGDVIAEPMTSADIDVCHRVPRRDEGCPNVVVQFTSRTKRNVVLEKARKKRVDTSQLGASDVSPIYVNEHLCPAVKKLLGQVVAKKHEKGWKYAWTKEGKIYARKSDTTRSLRVTCARDLEKMQ